MKEVQEVIEQLRRRGWTMTAIARAIGSNDVTLYRWWAGRNRPYNPVPVMLALQQLLDQPVPKRKYRRRKQRSDAIH